MALIIEAILSYLQNHGYKGKERFHSLEFGCGDGFQIPYLEKISEVTATDIYTSEEIRARQVKNFFECSITDTPFANGQFDLIFSNHVLEHIESLQSAFREMKRIGKQDCMYAFSVPTNVWLLLSLPVQYHHKFRKLLTQSELKSHSESPHTGNIKRMDLSEESIITRLFNCIRPRGHGVISNFLDCYRSLKIKAWEDIFKQNAFTVKEVHPLLLYAPSEWPIVPMTDVLNRFNICSSVLFLMQKV